MSTKVMCGSNMPAGYRPNGILFAWLKRASYIIFLLWKVRLILEGGGISGLSSLLMSGLSSPSVGGSLLLIRSLEVRS